MNEKFPSTIWSNLLIGSADSYLVRNYWKPIFHFIKSLETKEDPEDLTQEFLTQCLQKGFLDKVRIAKEKETFSFRGYLKISLKNFLQNRRQWRSAKKREGDFDHLSFQEERDAQLSSKEDPEKVFDYIWAKELMAHCYQILKVALGENFSIFYSFYLSDKKISLKKLAQEHQMSEKKLEYFLKKAQKQLQSIVTSELRKTVVKEEDISREIAFLKEALLGEL